MSTAQFQRVLSEFTNREILYCVSNLIYELIQKAECFPEDQEELYALAESLEYEEAAAQQGWERLKPDQYVFEQTGSLRQITASSEDAAWEHIAASTEHLSAREAAEDQDWVLIEDIEFVNMDEAETSEADDWEALCHEQRIEPYTREVYEHWLTTNFMARKLQAHGEIVTFDLMGLTVWGRTCTGQAISMDGVIEAIYREVWPEDFNEDGDYIGEAER